MPPAPSPQEKRSSLQDLRGKKSTRKGAFSLRDVGGFFYPSRRNQFQIGKNGTIATVYNVGKIEKSVLPSAKIIAGVGSKPLGKTPSKDGLPQKNPSVKSEFSLSDSDGNQLTEEQSDYFKDSKVRDDNGNLKVMYHGSEAENAKRKAL